MDGRDHGPDLLGELLHVGPGGDQIPAGQGHEALVREQVIQAVWLVAAPIVWNSCTMNESPASSGMVTAARYRGSLLPVAMTVRRLDGIPVITEVGMMSI